MNLSAYLTAPELFGYRKYWAHRLTPAPFLPMSREEMDALGWDQCDVILVTGDAYVDHPSFGMAIVGRVLEAQGFRVGIIAQPDWRSTGDFEALGRASAVLRHHGRQHGFDGESLHGGPARAARRRVHAATASVGQRPDRSVIVYSQRVREAFADTPIVIGGIEASLRRIAHYDYWQEKVRRSILLDARADLLVFGNGERQIVEIAHRLAAGEPPDDIKNVRGTAFLGAAAGEGWTEIDSTHLDTPGPVDKHPDPVRDGSGNRRGSTRVAAQRARRERRAFHAARADGRSRRAATFVSRAIEQVRDDPCCTRTRRGSCTWSRIPATRARSCSATAQATCG